MEAVGAVAIRNGCPEQLDFETQVWLLLGSDLDGPVCGAIQDGNDLSIVIIDGAPDWHYLIVVTSIPG